MIFQDKIIRQDCIEGMKKMPDGCCQLIVADPPYNLEKDFGEWKESEHKAEWLDWSKRWIDQCSRLLSPKGNFFIYGIHHHMCWIQCYLYELGLRYRRQIIWHYENGFAGYNKRSLAASVGGTKGRVSEDLAAVEELTGVKLRKGISHPNATRLTKLLKNTRAERKQGVRSACLYGWHSCRMYFVVTARRAGIDAETLKKITGHATVRMVEHYNNADKVEAANALREQMSHSAAKPQPTLLAAERPQEPSLAATIQAILANPDLTPEARNAAILALTAK